MLMMGLLLLGNNIGAVNAASVPDKNNSGFEITKKDGNVYLDGVVYYESAQEAYKAGLKQHDTKKVRGSHGGGHFYPDGWNKMKTSNYNTAYDRDELICKSKALKQQTLQVCSKTTIKITGSTKYNFAEVASLELSMEIGEEWSKTKTHVVKPQKGYKYLLESYLIVTRRDYTYYKNSKAKAQAASHDKLRAVVSFSDKQL